VKAVLPKYIFEISPEKNPRIDMTYSQKVLRQVRSIIIASAADHVYTAAVFVVAGKARSTSNVNESPMINKFNKV